MLVNALRRGAGAKVDAARRRQAPPDYAGPSGGQRTRQEADAHRGHAPDALPEMPARQAVPGTVRHVGALPPVRVRVRARTRLLHRRDVREHADHAAARVRHLRDPVAVLLEDAAGGRGAAARHDPADPAAHPGRVPVLADALAALRLAVRAGPGDRGPDGDRGIPAEALTVHADAATSGSS